MDAMSGQGELGDRGLVADFYGLGERAEYKTKRTGVDGADSRADWGGRGGQSGGRGGLHHTGRNIGLGGLGRTGRTAGHSGRSRVRNLGWGGLGRKGRTGGLAEWRTSRLWNPGRGKLVDWRTSGRGGLRNLGRGGLGQTGADEADGAEGGVWVVLGGA